MVAAPHASSRRFIAANTGRRTHNVQRRQYATDSDESRLVL